jgi:hypothetical protein
LPPEAHFVSGVGFSYHSRRVSFGFDFGLSHFHYSFVPVHNFCDYSPYRYVVPRARVQNFYRNTTVVNNYIVGNNNTVINRGIGRETIARSSQTRIREVTLRDRPVQNVSRIRGDQIDRQGNQLVAYRPQLPKDPPRIRTAQFANRTGAGQAQSATAVARPGTAVRNGSSGTANLSGTSTLPATGGRIPSSVGRGSRDVVATPSAPAAQAEQPNQAGDRNGRAVSRRGSAGSAAVEAGSRANPNPNVTESVSRNESRPTPQENAAAAQARYQRQQQLRSGPLFGSTVAGGTPASGNGNGRRSVEARNEAVAAPRAQAQPDTAQPLPQRGVQAQTQPQNNRSPSRSAEATIPLPGRVTQPAQPKPQYQAPPYNGNVSRPATRVYPQASPQAPAAQVQPRYNAPAQNSPARTVSPRQAEQSPRYSAPQQQAPRYSQPSQPAVRQYSAPAPQAPRAAPSGGNGGGGNRGGGGGRESAPSRGERSR